MLCHSLGLLAISARNLNFLHIPVLLLWCGWVLPHSPLLGCQQPGGFIQAPEVVALIKLGVTFLVIYLALTVLWLVLQSQILFGSRAFPYRYVCISPVLSLFLLSLGWFSPSPLALFSFFWDSFPFLSPFG